MTTRANRYWLLQSLHPQSITDGYWKQSLQSETIIVFIKSGSNQGKLRITLQNQT